jgi:hypothetical protein
MPDLGITPGGAEPPLALNRLALPAELLSRLKAGEALSARVVRQAGQGRFTINISGTQVSVESRLMLSVGQRLDLVVREAGARVLLDIVPASAQSAEGGASQVARPASPAATPAAQSTQQSAGAESPALSSAARMVQTEAQAALARSAPLGEIVQEVRRLIAEAAGRPAAAPTPQQVASKETATDSAQPAPGQSAPARQVGHAPTQPPPEQAPASVPPKTADAPAQGSEPPTARPQGFRAEMPAQSARPPGTAARASSAPIPPVPAPAPPPPTDGAPTVQTPEPTPSQTAAGDPAPVPPAGEQAAQTAQPTAPTQPRQFAELVRALLLVLPEFGAEGEVAEPPPALERGEIPAGQPAAQPGREQLGPEIARLLPSSPAALENLLDLVEAQAARVVASIPEAARLDALVGLLDRLPPPPAPSPAPVDAPASPAQEAPPAEPARAELGRLLEALLASPPPAREASGQERVALPTELRAELESLPPQHRAALRAMLLEREREVLSSAPRLAALNRAHRALLAAGQRVAVSRLGSLATSGAQSSFCYVEIPTACGAESATARLRVMVKRDGSPRGGHPDSRRRPVRAIMDITLSELGEVWTEMVLSGKQLAVRMELPDRERRDFVAAQLPELEESLAARGLEAQATAEARKPADGLSGQMWPEAVFDGRLDLWA